MDVFVLTRRTCIAGLAGALALPAVAQVERPVRFILPNAVGSGVDAITRAASQALSKALGHTVIVDNQPGAGGIIGLQALTRSAPDGLTLGVVSNNVVIFPSVMKSLPFDMPGDFTPIAVVGYTPIVLVVNPKVPAKDAKEFVALLKSRNGEMPMHRVATARSSTSRARCSSRRRRPRRATSRTRASARW